MTEAGQPLMAGPPPTYDSVSVGDDLPGAQFSIERADLIRYAGASGDFNVIHWNERVAREVGLPDVIAHGMFTMAEAVRVLTDWTGDPGSVVEIGVRFVRPVVVPDDGVGATLVVGGRVTDKLDGQRVRVDLTATSAGDKVLGQARGIVRLP